MIRLANPYLKLDVLPRFGARWIRLRAKIGSQWKDLLWPPPELRHLERKPLFGGAFLMAPWCNRIPNARFTFKREGFQVRPNFPDGSAIHGDVYSRPWQVIASSSTSVNLAYDSAPEPDFNFPFDFRFGHRIRLNGPRIEASIAAMNVGDEPAPVGLGFHPFFLRRLSPRGEPAMIAIPARTYFPSQNAIPTGPAKPVSGLFDARSSVSLGERVFDTSYMGFGDRPALLFYPEERFEIWLTPGPDVKHLYVWSPAYYEGRSSPFVCIEPMSMSVNGLARREEKAWDSGVVILAPKERFSISWTIEVGERL